MRTNAILTTAFVASIAAMASAQAGGFTRGTADTDLLYEEGNFNMRAGAAIVSPQRGYATITSPLLGGTVAGTDGTYTDDYVIPGGAIKINLFDDLRCAGTYTQSFGGDVTYGPQAITAGLADGSGTMRRNFYTNEFGVTCGYKFDLSKGRAWVIGGIFGEDITYSESARLVPGHPLAFGSANAVATLAFNGGYKLGYRAGVAYEIPEIALRGELLYRSEIDHGPGGSFTVVDTMTGFAFPALPAAAAGTLPQSLELKLQSGIAPGWLAFGSVKWTDWSALDKLNYTIFTPIGPVPTALEFYWRDGWTVTGGIGHQFTDNVSGALSLTWDRGVSTTEDALTDTWTLGLGAILTDSMGGQLRLGGAVSYLTSGSVAAEANPLVGGPGNTFAYTVGGDWTFAAAASYKIKW